MPVVVESAEWRKMELWLCDCIALRDKGNTGDGVQEGCTSVGLKGQMPINSLV